MDAARLDGHLTTPKVIDAPFRLYPFPALTLDPRSPRNRLLRNRRYRAAARTLGTWQRGHYVEDRTEALYLHEYTSDGLTIRGLVGLLELTHTSGGGNTSPAVFPHERVSAAHTARLSARIEELGLHPAPILLVHNGEASVRGALARVASLPPSRDFTDSAGQRHRWWRIDDAMLVATLAGALASTSAMIGDGHHRYAAYLQAQHRHPGTPHDLGMVMLVDQQDTPFFLGAIHRHLPGISTADLHGFTSLRELHDPQPLDALDKRTLVLHDDTGWYAADLPPELGLPICHLHNEVLPRAGVDQEQISYHHTVQETLAARDTEGGLAVLLPAPAFDELFESARNGVLLPQKATSFQPKPSVGIITRPIRENAGQTPDSASTH